MAIALYLRALTLGRAIYISLATTSPTGSTRMRTRHIACFLYCCLATIAPVGHSSPLHDIFHTVTCLLSFPQFSFFRLYTALGQAHTKTVLHGMFISHAYAFQTFLVCLNALTLFGKFGLAADTLLKTHPDIFHSRHYYPSCNPLPALHSSAQTFHGD